MNTDKNIIWNLYDIIIVCYSLSMLLLIFIFGQSLSEYKEEIFFYAGTIIISCILVYFLKEDKNRFTKFIRLFYPIILFSFFYRMTGGLMFLFFDSFYDGYLTALEKKLFGVNPTIFIDRYLLNRFINEIFSICYFLYYPMIPWFFFLSYSKKDYAIFKKSLSAVCLTFFISYLLFSVFPIEGPRWFFAEAYNNEIRGYIFRPLVEVIMANGAVRGGCMPSSHFAVALVILIFAYKYYRNWAYYLIPIVAGLAIATFWGRYHYFSDVVIGGLIAVLSYFIIRKIDNYPKTP